MLISSGDTSKKDNILQLCLVYFNFFFWQYSCGKKINCKKLIMQVTWTARWSYSSVIMSACIIMEHCSTTASYNRLTLLLELLSRTILFKYYASRYLYVCMYVYAYSYNRASEGEGKMRKLMGILLEWVDRQYEYWWRGGGAPGTHGCKKIWTQSVMWMTRCFIVVCCLTEIMLGGVKSSPPPYPALSSLLWCPPLVCLQLSYGYI